MGYRSDSVTVSRDMGPLSLCLELRPSGTSKCHFQSVLLGHAILILVYTGESPQNFPSRPHENDTCAMTPMHSNTRVVFLKSPSEPPCGQWNSFSFMQRGPPKNDAMGVSFVPFNDVMESQRKFGEPLKST